MGAEKFIITTSIEGRAVQRIWDSSRPIKLNMDYQSIWHLEKTPVGGLQAVCRETMGLSRLYLDKPDAGETSEVELVHPVSRKVISLSLRRANLPRPAYLQMAEEIRSEANRLGAEFYISQGMGESLMRFESFDRSWVGRASISVPGKSASSKKRRIFRLKKVSPAGKLLSHFIKQTEGYQIKSLHSDLEIWYPSRSEPLMLRRGQKATLEKQDLIQSTLIQGRNWWMPKRVAALTDEEMAVFLKQVTEPGMAYLDEDIDEEKLWLRKLNRNLVLGFAILSLLAWIFSKVDSKLQHPKPAPLPTTTLNLRKPKAIAMPKPAPMPAPPHSAAAPKAPPKAPPRHAVAHPHPHPHPHPHVQPRPQPPRPVAPVAPPRPVVPPKVVQARNLARSLNFLTTAHTPFVANTSNSKADARFKQPVRRIAARNDSPQALNRLAKDVPTSDGPIETRNARTMNTQMGFAGHDKALNEVQGRVSLRNLYSPGSASDVGSALGGQGLSLSGEGKADEFEIARVLAKNLSRFQYCYEKALLSDPSLTGRISMQWVIGAGGVASGVKVIRSQLNNGGLHQCLAHEIERLHFPSPRGGSVIVNYPFVFSSTKI